MVFRTHLPGEPRVHRLRSPLAQKRSVLDAFGKLGLGPHATGTGVAHFQVVRHRGRVGGQFEKIEAAVHARAHDAADAVADRRRFFFAIVVVSVADDAAAPAPAPAPVANASAATVTGQRTLVVAPTRVRIAATATSIIAAA